MIRALAVVGLLFIVGCATTPVLSPRELHASAAALDGQVLQARGMLVLGTNGRSLYQSRARWGEWQEHFHVAGEIDRAAFADDCLMLLNADQLLAHGSRLHGASVTIKGTFIADYYTPNAFDLARCSERPSAFVIDDESIRFILRAAGVGDPGKNRQAED